MKLLTKGITDKLPALYSTDGKPASERKVIAKFFSPVGSWTWYVLEGSPVGDDFRFFGLVNGHEREFGYFSLKELESVRLPLGLGIERDIHFTPITLAELESRLEAGKHV